MLLFKQVEPMQRYLVHQRARGMSIGFIPTMGALHKGHLALVHQARTENQLSVCSIFVNPTQFNESSDLETYPRLPGPDIDHLILAGNDVLFMPPVEEIYPSSLPEQPPVDLEGLDEIMEGAFRPGHFSGVAQVVGRLLDIIGPRRLYMGQKDYQQAAIIAHLIRVSGRLVQLRVHPTIREPDGLAMSSRNTRLSPKEREEAILLYQVLQEVRRGFEEQQSPVALEQHAIERLQRPGFKPEYVTIADRKTLKPFDRSQPNNGAVVCAACWVGDVRLIDNLLI